MHHSEMSIANTLCGEGDHSRLPMLFQCQLHQWFNRKSRFIKMGSEPGCLWFGGLG